MTTAARPTYDTARGGSGKSENDLGALSKQYSSRDLPAHTKLKYRQEGQNSSTEVKARDFKRELDEKEKSTKDKKPKSSKEITSKKARTELLPLTNLDADDPLEDEDDDDGDDEEDDAAMLMAELAKIKNERRAELAKKEAERKAEEDRVKMENLLKGNPLINQEKVAVEFKVKRRWDDDVVFKNCARNDGKKAPSYINDTLRSEFHKKFMEKYIK